MLRIRTKGFSLIECIVSISVAGLLLSLIMPVLLMFYQEHALFLNKQKKILSGDFVSVRISRQIRNAVQILPESSTSQLCLLNNTVPTREIKYEYVNGKVREKYGNSYHYLTDENIVESLSFTYENRLIRYRIGFADGSVISRDILVRTVT
ncbi:type II secretion system protein [Candidatus Margulisiibacteriota bacterium]